MNFLRRGVYSLSSFLKEKRGWRSLRAPVALHLNAVGDRLIVLPALRALCSLYPHRVTLVGTLGDQSLLYSDLPLKAFHPCPWKVENRVPRFDYRDVVRGISECDLLVALNGWWSDDILELMQCFPEAKTLGHFPEFESHLPLTQWRNAKQQAFELIRRLDRRLRMEDFSQPPLLPEADRALAGQIMAAVPPEARVLALHTEPSGATRRWPVERFQRVLEAFLEQHPEYLVLVVDYHPLEMELERHADRVLLCSGASLGVAMSIVANADLFLGVDSCMLHAADFFRVPAVGLFGPTPPSRWGFRFGPHRYVKVDGPMALIQEGPVLEALQQLARAHVRPRSAAARAEAAASHLLGGAA
ncbi:glycosyltransferase family 9 protein [Pyxidicoccus fallax]|uniref:Glycosyltransferase family 9 protein n=1 Tax=Pyxidicoccus fallax TaxID=394095 RepID=A0A848L7W0_9BACT|nr:glycosyltransferase family 9 protein [Pyxidicoccus fallax]NMO14647.1 glycosyltransferase family 9 protein [Pyxidicoccus fallax]NPC79520.1 glycosyltransferase family 9 protein [Pyxidicoccus fallax]